MHRTYPTIFKQDNKTSICVFWNGDTKYLGEQLTVEQIELRFANEPMYQCSFAQLDNYNIKFIPLEMITIRKESPLVKDVLRVDFNNVNTAQLKARIYNADDDYLEVAIPLETGQIKANSHYNLIIRNTKEGLKADFIYKGQSRFINRELYSQELIQVLNRLFGAATLIRVQELKLINAIETRSNIDPNINEQTTQVMINGLISLLELLTDESMQQLYLETKKLEPNEKAFVVLLLSQPNMRSQFKKVLYDTLKSGVPTATNENIEKVIKTMMASIDRQVESQHNVGYHFA